jgi:hypothetical protein
MPNYRCGNADCGKRLKEKDLEPLTSTDPSDLGIQPGDRWPFGECPECGGLVDEEKEPVEYTELIINGDDGPTDRAVVVFTHNPRLNVNKALTNLDDQEALASVGLTVLEYKSSGPPIVVHRGDKP